jgi:DNA invertase Pin-like site-specific DNA recombinase
MAHPYAYLRKSSVHNDQRDLSPETQEREVRDLAARHNDNGDRLTILADWDISGRGKYTEKRANYLRLKAAIESGECSAVYSYSLSRLGRSVAELSKLFDLCHERGVPVRLVADSVDTSTASGRLLANVLASVAQFEAEVAGERVAGMYATKREKGEAIRTRKRYGEREGQDIDDVLRAYDEAGTFSGAARLLNERGVAPSSGKPRRLVAADGTVTERRVWWASSVAVVVKHARPALATRPTRQGERGGEGFLLTKLLRCGTCGSMLTGSRIPGRKGDKVYVRYACRFGESSPHPRVAVAENQLIDWIKAEAARLRIPYDTLDMEAANDKRARLEAQRKAIGDALVDGLYTRAQARERSVTIDAQLAALERTTTSVDIPKVVDWSMPTATVNGILRGLWQEVQLGTDLRPVRALWWVEDWRA